LDENLIRRLSLKDEQAFELLFRRYYDMLCRFATHFIHDQQLAEDIVQEVFYKLWRNPSNLNSQKNIASYLMKAVQNQGINILDHEQIERKYAQIILSTQSESHQPTQFEQLHVHELEKKISSAMNKLSPGVREIFELSRNHGLKYREIAEQLQISIKTVETQMSRALVILRHELKDYITYIIAIILLNQ